jgi:hypothetical protein
MGHAGQISGLITNAGCVVIASGYIDGSLESYHDHPDVKTFLESFREFTPGATGQPDGVEKVMTAKMIDSGNGGGGDSAGKITMRLGRARVGIWNFRVLPSHEPASDAASDEIKFPPHLRVEFSTAFDTVESATRAVQSLWFGRALRLLFRYVVIAASSAKP